MKAVIITNTKPFFTINSVSSIVYLNIENPKENGINKTNAVGRNIHGLRRKFGVLTKTLIKREYKNPIPPSKNPYIIILSGFFKLLSVNLR